MLIEGLEKNNVSNYQFFFPIFPKVVLLIDIISSAWNILLPLSRGFSWNISQHYLSEQATKQWKQIAMWGGRENPLVILDLCDSFLLLHMAHSLSHREKYCCLLKLLLVQLGKHICPWMLSFWNTMLELFQMVERLRYCYIGVEQCCD